MQKHHTTKNKPAASLQFGLGRACINPQMPISLAGYFNVRMWEKVLDDIEVRVLALRSGDDWAALIQYDLVYVSQNLADALYAALKTAGLWLFRPENMILTATHTHTAPEIRLGKPTADIRYNNFVVEQTLAAIRQAQAGMAAGEILAGITRERRFIFNRRYWMAGGGVTTNPGKLNPAIERPEGEIDPEIPLLAIARDGQIRVLLANIVNHSDTIGGNDVSGDWPGFTRRSLEESLGAGSMAIPLIGASGNINHFDVRSGENQTCYAEARRIGQGYAETIRQALPAMQAMPAKSFFTRALRVAIEPREISAAELAEAREVMERYKDLPPAPPGRMLTSEDLVKQTPEVMRSFAAKILEMALFREPMEMLLTGLFIGRAGIASLPCEPFTEIGLALRKEIFPEFHLLVAELSNGTGNAKIPSSYIPNPWNYGRGGYETTPRSNQFAADTAARLLGAWRAAAGEIKAAAAPSTAAGK